MRSRIVILIALTCLLLAASPAQAITGGQPDGTRHPYVGLVTDFQFVCSGALISPTIFITAAHCFEEPGQEVFVTFDPEGFFGDPVFFSGTWYPDPDFCVACGGGLPGFDTHDVAVVVLDRPVPKRVVSRYAQLPTEGLVDTLAPGTELTIVGYGVQNFTTGGGPPQVGDLFTRFFAPVLLVEGEDTLSDEFIKVTANQAKGKGGVCFGDSGGPVLLGDTIIAVNSFGTNSLCRGVTYSYRIDTAEALSFINSVIATYG